MTTSRRSVLAAAGAGLASVPVTAAAACIAPQTGIDAEVAKLIRLSEESNAALMRGDGERYFSMIAMTDDFTLMSPFGGTPTHGVNIKTEHQEAIGRFFRNGTLKTEVVQSYASDDMVVLALIEHAHAEVGGLPSQEWPLRVTLVYRREASAWRLVHRHADPLVKSISLKQAASLARGEAA